jgi:hypothetical protein
MTITEKAHALAREEPSDFGFRAFSGNRLYNQGKWQ